MNIQREIRRNKINTLLILFVYTILVLSLVFVASFLIGSVQDFPAMAGFVLVFVGVWTLVSYFFGDKIIASFVDAKPLEKKDNPELYNLLENLCITTGMSMPKLYVIQDQSLNAFATGRNPKKSMIVVTTGLLEKLNKAETEAVLAHELAHIANYDIRLQLIVTTVAGAIAILGESLMRSRGKKAGPVILTGLIITIIGIPLLRITLLALSRNREYFADSTGSFFTRRPEQLANALEKIRQDSRVESADQINSAAHLFIANPKKEPRNDTKKHLQQESFLTRLFSTHPPIFERIKRLKNQVKDYA